MRTEGYTVFLTKAQVNRLRVILAPDVPTDNDIDGWLTGAVTRRINHDYRVEQAKVKRIVEDQLPFKKVDKPSRLDKAQLKAVRAMIDENRRKYNG